ncbi:Chemotaxis response regulator protein-glutamate methylesterase [Grimontia celer]|uniref:Chemotaxis response regulator protein-glutamate methylesterase n=1 Tax=Grimontia celer TaxID=1796497 RepID=A0A128F3C1_9GAMM|nr:response regulator [Grimontia celer]CZF81035.1 Chemotaxis response regulator protein-glutamate methylesterase [Grimontia celer]
MKIIFADDMADMRENILESLDALEKDFGPFEILGQAKDGRELISLVERNPSVDLVLTDLRMPNMDGLSALVYLRANCNIKNIVVISSESLVSISQAEKIKVDADTEEKLALLDKIAHRVIDDEVVEGKISSILIGCEKLRLDPIQVVEYYGATGYMRKPITKRKMHGLFEELNKTDSFINIGIV